MWVPSGAPSLTWSTAKAVHQEQASPLSSCHQGFVSQEPAAGGAWSLCFSLANWPNVHNTWPQPKLERNQMTLHQCLFSFKWCLAILTWEDHCFDKSFSTLPLQKCTLGKVSVLPSAHFFVWSSDTGTVWKFGGLWIIAQKMVDRWRSGGELVRILNRCFGRKSKTDASLAASRL